MSAQVAMLAGTSALGAFSSIAGGMAQGAGYEGKAAQMDLAGKSTDVEAAEIRAQAQNEELQRRKGLLRLLSANRADLAGRGVSGEQGSSFDVIQDYNTDEAGADIGNIRFMGESKIRRLSFAKEGYKQQASQFMNMASMARTQGFFGAARTIGMAGLSYFGMPSFGGGGGVNAGVGGTAP